MFSTIEVMILNHASKMRKVEKRRLVDGKK